MVDQLNDAPILDQMDGQYEKILMMVLRKYFPGTSVVITHTDIEEHLLEKDGFVLLTWGHYDSVEFKAIRRSEADRLKAHNETLKGGA